MKVKIQTPLATRLALIVNGEHLFLGGGWHRALQFSSILAIKTHNQSCVKSQAL